MDPLNPNQVNSSSPILQNVSTIGMTVPPAIPPTTPQIIVPKKNKNLLALGVVILVIIGISLGAVAYAYVYKIGPFITAPYSEENFISGLLSKTKEITSSSYSLSSSLDVVPRETGALPFAVEVTNQEELQVKYANDSERAKDISFLLQTLLSKYGDGTMAVRVNKGKILPYPVSLARVLSDGVGNNTRLKSDRSIIDPVSQKQYEYSVTNNGRGFILTVTFELLSSIGEIRKSNSYNAVGTTINDRTVTFTENSYENYVYLSLPNEPPEPLLVRLGEMMVYLPPDVRGSITVGATTDWGTSELAAWSVRLSSEADLGDLTYQFDVEALKKVDTYYFRINKMPSIAFISSSFSSFKGQWIKVSPQATTTSLKNSLSSYDSLSLISTKFPSYEKSYKERQAKLTELMRKMAVTGDEEKLITFKNPPHLEDVDGSKMYRYDLGIRKEAIIPFFEKFFEEVRKDKDFHNAVLNDQGLLEYLQSPEFNQVFDYFDKNITLSVWVDKEGYLAAAKYMLRIVPPDTSVQLKGKQVIVAFDLKITDINKPVNINEPNGARAIEDIIEESKKNVYNSQSGDIVVQRNLSGIRAQAELNYDTNGTYGKKSFALGSCRAEKDTLFGDANVLKSLNEATANDIGKAICISTLKNYAISVPLPSSKGYSWCIDSTGFSKKIIGAVKGVACK